MAVLGDVVFVGFYLVLCSIFFTVLNVEITSLGMFISGSILVCIGVIGMSIQEIYRKSKEDKKK